MSAFRLNTRGCPRQRSDRCRETLHHRDLCGTRDVHCWPNPAGRSLIPVRNQRVQVLVSTLLTFLRRLVARPFGQVYIPPQRHLTRAVGLHLGSTIKGHKNARPGEIPRIVPRQNGNIRRSSLEPIHTRAVALTRFSTADRTLGVVLVVHLSENRAYSL